MADWHIEATDLDTGEPTRITVNDGDDGVALTVRVAGRRLGLSATEATRFYVALGQVSQD